MRALIPALAGLLSLLPGSAFADIFIGASLGEASIEDPEQGITLDADDLGYKVFAGFRMLKFLGFEASYVDLGRPDDSSSGLTLDLEGNGWDVFAVGVLPLGERLELFGKAGLVYWDIEGTLSDGTSVLSRDDSGIEVAYGLGAGFRFGEHLTFRLERESFEIDKAREVNLTSIGLVLTF
ncbi:MAG: outer membrane beta-barrel protein [Acidobacteriota bacterium]